MTDLPQKRKMERRIVISDDQILYEIFTENENGKGGFNYTLRRLMIIEEATEVISKLSKERE